MDPESPHIIRVRLLHSVICRLDAAPEGYEALHSAFRIDNRLRIDRFLLTFYHWRGNIDPGHTGYGTHFCRRVPDRTGKRDIKDHVNQGAGGEKKGLLPLTF